MSLSRSPRLIKAGLVMIDPQSARVRRVIALQYNPEKLTRSLQVQGAGEGAERSAMSSTLEIIHKYHIISAQISAWEKPF